MLRTKKILRDSVREYRGISLRAPVYVTLESIMECVIPFLMAMLIDYGIDGNHGAGDMGYIWKMGLILIGCTVITLLFGALAGKTAAEASAGYAKNLRHDLYYHVQDFSFSNIERFFHRQPRDPHDHGRSPTCRWPSRCASAYSSAPR